MGYGYTKEFKGSFQEAEKKLREELSKEGFGILTEIDVKSTMKKKLNVDFEDYKILGACNPPFAHKALLAEKELGLLLPCNCIVYVKEDKTFVSCIIPTISMSNVKNDSLIPIALEVESKLKRVIDNVSK